MGQLGLCDRGTFSCSPVKLPYQREVHGRVFGWNAGSVRWSGRLPGHSTFYTNHAQWLTPRGARMMLACSRHCLVHLGWGVDSLAKFLCVDKWRRREPKLLVEIARSRGHYCDGTEFAFAHSKVPATDLRCVGPPVEHWHTFGEPGELDPRQKIFMGFFWQNRSDGASELLKRRTLQREELRAAAAKAKVDRAEARESRGQARAVLNQSDSSRTGTSRNHRLA